MASFTNTAEGGTDGTAVDTVNSGGGSGTAFGSVTTDSGATLTYSATAANTGALSYHHAASVSGHTYYGTGSWTSTKGRLRFYVNFSSLVAFQFIQTVDSNAALCYLNTTASGGFAVVNAAGTVLYSSTGKVSTGTWYRVEFIIVRGTSTSTGTLQYALYSGNSTVALDSFTTSTTNAGTGTLTRFNIGKVSSGSACDFYIDDIAADDTAATFIGPVQTATAAFTGSGTLTASGIKVSAGKAVFTGSGALTTTGVPKLRSTAAMSGSGTLIPHNSVTAQNISPQQWNGSSWVQLPIYRWSGTAWVVTTITGY